MCPDLSAQRLRSVIEKLVAENDPRQRDRLLVAGARRAVGATAAALWRESAPGAWLRVCALGQEPDLPSGTQLEGVARGSHACLPPGCVLVIAGTGDERCALALGGLVADAAEEAEELLEPLLMLHDSLERDGTAIGDRVLPPFTAAGMAPSTTDARGVHRPQRGPADGELRALLSRIREAQQRLARGALGAEERDRAGELLDQQCQRAGDLLLGPDAGPPSTGECSPDRP